MEESSSGFLGFRVIDISSTVVPNKMEAGRPFHAMRSDTLPDGKDTEVVFTHTHVGTHLEAAKHFFRQGKGVTDFPLTRFMGAATLVGVGGEGKEDLEISGEYLRENFEKEISFGDIVVFRNNSGEGGDDPHSLDQAPYFAPSAAGFLVELGVKMVVVGNVSLGSNIERGKEFEGKLHEEDIPLLENPAHLQRITQKKLYVIAVPMKVEGVGSCWTRAFVLEAK